MNEPQPDRPYMPGYGIPEAAPDVAKYPWSWATARLAAARNYWIVTTRPDGRPHAMPVWGLWLDDAFYFSTAPHSRKGRNIAAHPYIVVHLESGDEMVTLEGEVARVTDEPTLARFVAAYEPKYNFRPDPTNPDQAVYVLRPQVAFTWQERDYPESATRWRFAREL